jgi:hypothetical protein
MVFHPLYNSHKFHSGQHYNLGGSLRSIEDEQSNKLIDHKSSLFQLQSKDARPKYRAIATAAPVQVKLLVQSAEYRLQAQTRKEFSAASAVG